MTKAFVFGKFLPFHKGHEAMIRFGLTKCDHLSVLVCSSDKEEVSGDVRKQWIDDIFYDEERINVKVYPYNESELPNSSDSSDEISQIWSRVFKSICPDANLLITSEPYGDMVADYMDIEHIAFDPKRRLVPVSATKIKSNLAKYWLYLPAPVRKYYSKKVIILGTESTGKTTLTKLLGNHFRCGYVLEAARDIIENSNAFGMDDLNLVLTEHTRRIEETVQSHGPLVVVDTDFHITKSYASYFFKKELFVHDEIYEAQKGDLYLYLVNDVPFVQDGTRLDEAERNALDKSHRNLLQTNGIEIVEIDGNWQERFQKASVEVLKLLDKRK